MKKERQVSSKPKITKEAKKKVIWGTSIFLVALLLVFGITYLVSTRNRGVRDTATLTEKESLEAIKKLSKAIEKYIHVEDESYQDVCVNDFHNGLARVYRDKKWGCINVWGEEVIPCEYDIVFDFSEGFAAVIKNDLWGVINTEGVEVVPCKYIDDDGYVVIDHFSEGLAAVRENGKYGYINTKGEKVIPCIYDNTRRFSEGLAWVHDDKSRQGGYINTKGEMVVPYEYFMGSDFSNGLARVQKSLYESYFIDKNGNIVHGQDCQIPFVSDFHDNLALTQDQFISPRGEKNGNYNKYGYMDIEGRNVIPCRYQSAADFEEGMAAVSNDEGKIGFINTEGELVIPYIYDMMENLYGHCCDARSYSFSEGLAAVCQDGKYGYIDKQGNTVVPLRYIWAEPFSEGFARVMIDGGKWGYVDKYGNSTFDYQ